MPTSSIHHWAGIASLQLREDDVLPGFAEISLEAVDSELTSWDGRFFSGSVTPELLKGASTELLLPRDITVAATVNSNEGGILSLSGRDRWQSWEELIREVEEVEGPTLVVKDGYMEVRGASVISPANWVDAGTLPVREGQKMLVDYRPVQQIFVPFQSFVEAGETLERLGAKVAVVASSALAFGISRQTILTAGLDEERRFRVFWDYDEALLWLLTEA